MLTFIELDSRNLEKEVEQ